MYDEPVESGKPSDDESPKERGEVCIVHIVHIVYNSKIGCATSTIILY